MNEQAELGWNGQKTMLPMIEGTAGAFSPGFDTLAVFRAAEVILVLLVFAASGPDFALYFPCGIPAWSSSVDGADYDDPADRGELLCFYRSDRL